MYNVRWIGHEQAVLVSIKFKLTHVPARMTSPIYFISIKAREGDAGLSTDRVESRRFGASVVQ